MPVSAVSPGLAWMDPALGLVCIINIILGRIVEYHRQDIVTNYCQCFIYLFLEDPRPSDDRK